MTEQEFMRLVDQYASETEGINRHWRNHWAAVRSMSDKNRRNAPEYKRCAEELAEQRKQTDAKIRAAFNSRNQEKHMPKTITDPYTGQPRTIGMVVYMIGNLSEGFRPVGPFASYSEASDWADDNPNTVGITGWMMEVFPPTAMDEELAGPSEEN